MIEESESTIMLIEITNDQSRDNHSKTCCGIEGRTKRSID
ncbi:hypothetical protein J2S10_004604 [Neobacillus ginsengisoli]|uniref:Uncharacterized protein n=1 Tax=Neobacillus ginsengisoli TaxID=904295 RepID=A0ABT9Y0Q8_9BACI|nr:hypothetical protein [Neobacillus ginsengisoli]